MEVNDDVLVRRVQAGDRWAFDELVRRHGERVLLVARGIVGDHADACDVHQNTFIRAYSRIDTFRFDSSFGTWLTRITVNQAINFRKKQRWKQRLSLDALFTRASPVVDEVERSGAFEPSDERLLRGEVAERVEQGMAFLSDRERAVFVLKHMQGYKIREIADMIGCAEGSVKSYLFRAVKKMRSALEPYYEQT